VLVLPEAIPLFLVYEVRRTLCIHSGGPPTVKESVFFLINSIPGSRRLR